MLSRCRRRVDIVVDRRPGTKQLTQLASQPDCGDRSAGRRVPSPYQRMATTEPELKQVGGGTLEGEGVDALQMDIEWK